MRRREFIAGLGAAAWPSVARAQQRERMRRIGVFLGALAPDDPEAQARVTAFVQGLRRLGLTDGRNVQIDYRFGVRDDERLRRYAAELVALAPDVILTGGNLALEAMQRATSTLPIVFANVTDPVGYGFVASLARPGANTTGFMNIEVGLSAKLLDLLKQLAPGVMRVAVLRDPAAGTIGPMGAIQAVAPSYGVEVIPLLGRDAGEIERAITSFARGPNGGLIVPGLFGHIERDMIIALAARQRLPAVYPFRSFVTAGGLISYAPDQTEPYRLAAGYVDRILKGEKPADLPVQAPVKFETVLNLKTAKALGVTIPEALLATADEIIQ
jgi:putative tryptophan/tyrosine transport system substrate-binding protein